MITTQFELETALLDGGTIDVDSSTVIVLDAPMLVEQPTTLRGGRFVCTEGPAFMVGSSDVTFDGVRFTGGSPTTGYDATQKLIHAQGTETNPLYRVRVRDCAFAGSRGDNIWLEWCSDSAVVGNTIEDFAYSGVMVLSGRHVRVQDNDIRDAALSEGVPNVYGIAISDLANTESARSRDCVISGNVVEQIDWEGIDTHGGYRLTITGNHVVGCPRGIALVTGNASRLFAPAGVLVDGNTISATGVRAPALAGVYLGGIAGKPASATITGNQITGYNGKSVVTSYWDRGNTYVGGNSRPFVPWSDIVMGADYTAHATYPPQYMVDGDTVRLRGGIIPKSGGVSTRDDVGSLPHAGAWPDKLTVACFAKGSNPGAGNGQVMVDTNGSVVMAYGAGTDTYTYWLSGSYPVP